MNKRVTIGAKPRAGSNLDTLDEWVNERKIPEETKRLTIDVTRSLHTAIKMDCARRGVKMADEIRTLLEQRFLNNGAEGANTEK